MTCSTVKDDLDQNETAELENDRDFRGSLNGSVMDLLPQGMQNNARQGLLTEVGQLLSLHMKSRCP